METVDTLSIITIAFLGSFGHCIGMCGGIVIAYSTAGKLEERSKLGQGLIHVLYSLGRVVTYSLLGAIFGFLGGVVVFDNVTSAILLTIAGVAMILAGLALMGKLHLLGLLESSFASSSWYQSSFRALIKSQSVTGYFLLGMLNGLLPCGFVYFFAITAASTASPIYGAIVMFIFGLSTLPSLFGLGFFVGLFKQARFRQGMTILAAGAVIIYGLFTLFDAYQYLMDPTRSILDCH